MTQKKHEIFEFERQRLQGLAYRMLGVTGDAEDILQEAWLRWHKADLDEIEQPAAWLTTIITRLAIDRLRSALRARQEYIGPWLPEPILIDPARGPESHAEMASSLSIAFLLILEKLTPTERAVFLLREAFEYDHGEIAAIIGKTKPACRQILTRAKTRLAGQRPRFNIDTQEHQRLLYAFVAAVADGDLDGLLGLLAYDIELWSDGGGKATAALNVVYGAANVARFFIMTQKKSGNGISLEERSINGLSGIIALREGAIDLALSIEAQDGHIHRIFVMRNPDKLTRLH